MKSFRQRLKDSITPFHEQAQKLGPLNSIVAGSITMNEYKDCLGRLYGFTLPAERVIERLMANSGLKLDYQLMRRTPHLVMDLAFLDTGQAEIDRLPLNKELSEVDSAPKALGLLYLFEGSRLGGLTLAGLLRNHFGFTNLQGYAYFASDGENVHVLWRSFRKELDRYVARAGNEDEIIESARRSFSALNAWLLGS
jgi:heme oxygenase